MKTVSKVLSIEPLWDMGQGVCSKLSISTPQDVDDSKEIDYETSRCSV
jgi:hypothetical protein